MQTAKVIKDLIINVEMLHYLYGITQKILELKKRLDRSEVA